MFCVSIFDKVKASRFNGLTWHTMPRHAVTKIDFDQNDHDHFDHHVTAGESTWAAKFVSFVSFVVVNCSAPPSHGARHAVTGKR